MKLWTTLPDGTEVEVIERRGRLIAADTTLPLHVSHPYLHGFALNVLGRACYLNDDTEWTGPFPTLADAREDCASAYDCDPDTGDDLPDEDDFTGSPDGTPKGQ